jgi:hypothetical protein
MTKETKRRGILIFAFLLIGWSLPWEVMIPPAQGAQFGGLIKKKLKDVTKQTDSDSTPESSSGNSAYNDRVLELNEENLGKLEKALMCEKDARTQVDAKFAKLLTSEQYQKCAMEASMSPEMMQLVQNPGTTQQAAQEQMLKVAALIEKKCGKNPNDVHKDDDLKQALDKCSSAGNLTNAQFSIAKERILPFCASGGQNKIKGQGNNVYFVYSSTEIGAIKPKCDKLRKLIE